MLLPGRCHCGNISFSLTWDPDPAEIPARACTCNFCTKHGGVWTSNPRGKLTIKVQDSNKVQKYTFGTRTAEFHICQRCGVVPVVTSRIDGRLYAVISVNVLEDAGRSLLKTTPASFEAEDEAKRLARRTRTWIPDVELVYA